MFLHCIRRAVIRHLQSAQNNKLCGGGMPLTFRCVLYSRLVVCGNIIQTLRLSPRQRGLPQPCPHFGEFSFCKPQIDFFSMLSWCNAQAVTWFGIRIKHYAFHTRLQTRCAEDPEITMSPCFTGPRRIVAVNIRMPFCMSKAINIRWAYPNSD